MERNRSDGRRGEHTTVLALCVRSNNTPIVQHDFVGNNFVAGKAVAWRMEGVDSSQHPAESRPRQPRPRVRRRPHARAVKPGSYWVEFRRPRSMVTPSAALLLPSQFVCPPARTANGWRAWVTASRGRGLGQPQRNIAAGRYRLASASRCCTSMIRFGWYTQHLPVEGCGTGGQQQRAAGPVGR